MNKLTLQFVSLSELTTFSKGLNTGYFINTNNLTLTAAIPAMQVGLALELYKATLIETTEKVYSYDLL